jgi:hypothetical protein
MRCYKLAPELRRTIFLSTTLQHTHNAFGFSYLMAYTAIVSLVRESLFPEVGE